MVCLLIINQNENQEMRMDDVFIYVNERWNENQSGGRYLEIRLITRVFIPMGEVGMESHFLEVTILPHLYYYYEKIIDNNNNSNYYYQNDYYYFIIFIFIIIIVLIIMLL